MEAGQSSQATTLPQQKTSETATQGRGNQATKFLSGNKRSHEDSSADPTNNNSGKDRSYRDFRARSGASKSPTAMNNLMSATRKAHLLEIENRGLQRALAKQETVNRSLSWKINALRKELADCKPQARSKCKIIQGDFLINRNDYDIMTDIFLTEHNLKKDGMEKKVRDMVEISGDNTERRIDKLKYTYYHSSLPNSIGTLEYLEYLSLRSSSIKSLPPSIGKLKNLKEIDLSQTGFLSHLPDEFCDLSSLNKLDHFESNIESLPSSIGKLKNLKEINLSRTKKLSHLPDEFGDLSSLNKLNLNGSYIESLPSSIGKLKNLKEINLSRTKKLSHLPDEFGDLSTLNELNLFYSRIRSLPSSIGKLKNLKEINLSHTQKLSHLPDEYESWRLDNLRYFTTRGSAIYSNMSDQEYKKYLFSLVQSCKLIGYMNILSERISSCDYNKLQHTLACNRAKSRIFTTVDNTLFQTMKLWPVLLGNAKRAFGYGGFRKRDFGIEPHDAVHWLLLNGIESFVALLNDRRNKAQT